MAKKKTAYREEKIAGEVILVDSGTEKLEIAPSSIKKIAATARHLIRITLKRKDLQKKEKTLKEKLKQITRLHAGFRGVSWVEGSKKLLVNPREEKTWLKANLKKWLKALYSSLVTEKEIIKITIISGRVSGQEIKKLLEEFFTKKGLGKKEREMVMDTKTVVEPNLKEIKKLANKQGKQLEQFYDAKDTTAVNIENI